MKTVKGKVAAITGAGSGIGRAVSVLLARHGCAVAISDLNSEGLRATAEQCRATGVRVLESKVDVAQREQIEAWATEVIREFGAVHVLINNAGVAVGATIEDTSYEDFEWLMQINFWGVVYGTKAFLAHLKAAGEGHIVNLSSLFGLIAVPTQGAYVASKFAVKGFTETLRQELQVDGIPIGVTSIHPGGIKTNIARAARTTHRAGWLNDASTSDFERLFKTTPERAAEDILRAILKNRSRQLIGRDAVVLDAVQRLLPALYQRLVVGGLRRRRRTLLGTRR